MTTMREDTDPTSTPAWSRWQVRIAETGEGAPVCLSLANTRNWRHGAVPQEHLSSYADIVRWMGARRLVDADRLAPLLGEVASHPRLARVELERTIALREAVYRVFSARAGGDALPRDDLALIVESFNEAVGRVELELAHDRLVPRQRAGTPGLGAARLQAALSAVSLLTSGRAGRVKECADDRGCGWLFVDTTRNGSRRFCFSNECGNRARQAAYRHRHRDPAGDSTSLRGSAGGASR
jgi:predicted RNA-binding Zn ribbon-like protein